MRHCHRHRRLALVPAAALLPALVPGDVAGQSLRGSRASVDLAYNRAVARGLHFYQTSNGILAAAERGRFVRLGGNENYGLHPFVEELPYVKPATRMFVERLSAQYRRACGERLIVTSAIRPTRRQPPNASPRSVHPTGMAIDLRKPQGQCLTWLRSTLISLEKKGVIDATEEFRPPHFHVVVFTDRYESYVERMTATK